MSGNGDMSASVPRTAAAALRLLESGAISAEELTQAMLARIADPRGEGSAAFLQVDVEGALAAARAADQSRRAGHAGPLAGIPVAIKDLFDIAGQVTRAGSLVLQGSPASQDSAAVARLRAAGAVILGRTHMNEFAYSALGTNPHVPQPRAPWQRDADDGRGRVPGGSTSGGAVAVADLLCLGALGSDTGGSTRIPAAFCGMTGWRPSQGRIPAAGAFPLAPRFDTPGLITRSVEDCRLFDAILSNSPHDLQKQPVNGLRLAIAKGTPFTGLDAAVEAAMDAALAVLRSAGAMLIAFPDHDWDEPAAALRSGQVTAVEALVSHGPLFERAAEYDPRVVARMRLGESVAATDYVRAIRRIAAAREAFDAKAQEIDAVLMPTVAILPPRLAELDDDTAFFAKNALALRNTLIASILDLPALSLPLATAGGEPAGLMLVGKRGEDRKLLAIAQTVEDILRR